jgi:hypothetical protein
VRPGALGLVLAAVITGCTRLPAGPPGEPAEPIPFSVRPLLSPASPSPMLEVRAGLVQTVVPHSWEARPLPASRFPQEGVVAAPRRLGPGPGPLRGLEAFWVDVAKLRIPSDYYYLVARGPALGRVLAREACRRTHHQVLVDHPPDLAGRLFSPSDYVALGTGTCRAEGRRLRWAYLVAAPGYGPLREVGIPTSGLYVWVAVVSGERARRVLEFIMSGTRFGSASIDQLLRAAVRAGSA